MVPATAERKNFPLAGRNLEQNQSGCRRPSAATSWEGEERWRDGERGEVERERKRGERRDREDGENVEQKQQDPAL